MADRAAALRALADAVEAEPRDGNIWLAPALEPLAPLLLPAATSLDACARLQAEVLPGYKYHLSAYVLPWAKVWDDSTPPASTCGEAPTLPRAWLAAILRALAAKEG